MKECVHRIAIGDFESCNNSAGGKNTVICEFPKWEGQKCPFDMLESGEISLADFYILWLEAISIEISESTK